MPRIPLTEDHESFIRQRHAAGDSMRSIAKALDRPNADISRVSKRMGLLWGNQNEIRTAAVRDRLASQRVFLAEQLLSDAISIRERMWDEYSVLVSTPDGVVTRKLEFPDAKAVSDFTKAVLSLLKSHELLEKIGAGTAADYAKSTLGQLKAALLEAEVVDQTVVDPVPAVCP